MLSLGERQSPQRQLIMRAGTLGKTQFIAMVDGECRLARVALQSHGARRG